MLAKSSSLSERAMKILLAADLHLHPFQQFSTVDQSGMNSRLVDGLNIVRQMRTLCGERKITQVFFLGDLAHDRSRLSISVMYGAWQTFKDLSEVAKIIFLVGNHDQATRSDTIHTLLPFSDLGEVIDVPTHKEFDGRTFFFVPHIPDPTNLRRTLADCKADILAFHQPLREALPAAATTDGDFCLADIPKRVKLAIGGDIHTRGFVGDKVFYVGSTLQHNFGERGQAKGFTILDTETLEMEFVESKAPQFVLFECNEDGPDPSTLDIAAADPETNFVRLSYNKRWQSAVSEIKERYPRVVLECQGEFADTLARVSADVLSDDAKLIEEYVTINAADWMSREKLTTLGMEVLSEHT